VKLLLPLVIALLGLGIGVGAGLALKPAPEETHAAADCPEGEEGRCEPAAPDPFEPVAKESHKPKGELTYVPLEKPFVVPVFKGEKVVAMVVLSLSVEIGLEEAPKVESIQPRLRDSFLKVMFRHANTGGFDGSFTSGQKMEDLKSALLKVANEASGAAHVSDVLITEIARQDS
jgi:flagellar protein FliL